jgi:O-antigen ligase
VNGGAGRVPIWTAGLEALKHFWVQGAGVNNFPEAYSAYAGFAPKFKGFGNASHNIYLGTWVELGIVGLTFFLLAIRSQFRAVRPAHDEFDPLLVGSEAAAWAILVAGFFIDIVWRKYFWFSWILLAVATQMPRKTQIRMDS